MLAPKVLSQRIMRMRLTVFKQRMIRFISFAKTRYYPVILAAWGVAWKRLRHPTWRDVLLLCLAIPAAGLLYILILIPFTPGIDDIRKATLDQPAQILFADGTKLAEFKPANREWVALSEISPVVVNALISTEDHRFYDHHGLDWRRLASSIFFTLSGDRQGGSTITQQLARNLYPDEIGRSATITRKLKEAITALKIEFVHTKPEILETYLNTVPFLYNAFGIEMAARTYFGTTAKDLDELQSATLVGMLKGNSSYNPVLNPERSIARRNTVLAQMVKHQKLHTAKFEQLKKKPLGIDFERQTEPPGPAPHFARQLRQWLIEWADRNDYSVYSDGLVVYTTLDSRLQSQAEQAVMRQGSLLQSVAEDLWSTRTVWQPDNSLILAFIRESAEYRAAMAAGLSAEQAMQQLQQDKDFLLRLREQKVQIQAGFLALDPASGQIKAWIGSRDFKKDGFDHVEQARRQPGSTFKPFVYAEAFRQGMSPEDTLIDQVIDIPVGKTEVWRPTDDKPATGRPWRLRSGLIHSRNTITAQLMQQVGPEKVAELAKAMGIRQSSLEAVPSLALGTSPVTLKEMVAAYGTIANSGNYQEPIAVLRIEDKTGKVLQEFSTAKPERALPADINYTLLDVMRGVVDTGTGVDIRTRYGIRADVAGKTGTTQDNADGWFILMHPQLVAGAWVGFNDSRITLRSDYWGLGARSALPIVGDFFRQALNRQFIDTQARFLAPDGTSKPLPALDKAPVQEDASSVEMQNSSEQTASTPDAAISESPAPDSASSAE